ncbi:uncharacterized protein LOC143518180 [Brachyhypopomus gauderio]|uniref:uncharacterized protein LOC143518180 n=1 Tax=Brachyhypopomus gauderio TaxID=698409 RepID=UPI0040417DCC
MSARYFHVLALCLVCGSGEQPPCVRDLVVRPGAAVTLECTCRMEQGWDVHWLRSCSPLVQAMVISTIRSIIKPTPRFSLSWNARTGSVDLSIENITEQDLGVYYCAQVERKMRNGSSGRLQESDVYHVCTNTSTQLLYEADPTVPPTCVECDCMPQWVLVLCSVGSALMTLLVSLCIFCCCKTGLRKTDERRDCAGEETNDMDVNYASLNMPKCSGQRTKRKMSQCAEFSTYSELYQEHR